MKHTKGPWIINGAEICTTEGEPIALICSTDDNAKLIASAPDMLKVLHSILLVEKNNYEKRVRQADIHNNTDGVGIDFDYISPEPLPQWVVEIEEIIKKATE